MTDSSFIIFGATGGIGSALCTRLAQSGARLGLVARDANRLEVLADELRTATPDRLFVTYPADATRATEVDAVFARGAETFGRIGGAVNLVGSILLKPAHLTSDAEFEGVLSQNLRSAFHVLRSAAPMMTPHGGSIVFVSSAAAQVGLPNHEAVAAAKGGVEGLVLSAAATYAPRGIRVNAVAPGLVRTPLAARITSSEQALRASTAMHPLGRIGEPEDVASAIAWLLDPENSWITGQVLGVDGGLSTVRAR